MTLPRLHQIRRRPRDVCGLPKGADGLATAYERGAFTEELVLPARYLLGCVAPIVALALIVLGVVSWLRACRRSSFPQVGRFERHVIPHPES